MSDPLSVGIDFGARGLRAAVLDSSRKSPFITEVELDPWIRYKPDPLEGAPDFASTKSLLTDTHVPLDGSPPPSAVVSNALEVLRQRVEAEFAASARSAVVCVPARYSGAHRDTLRTCVLAAGFEQVDLLNDSVAAVVAHRGRSSESTTDLVVSIGYSGVELALVGALSGSFRALGYEGGAQPTGASLDLVFLFAILGVLKELGIASRPGAWTAPTWVHARGAAERLKEGILTGGPVTMEVRDGERTVPFSPQGAPLVKVIEEAFWTALQGVSSLIARSSVELADIDDLLVVGRTAQTSMVVDALTRVGGRAPILLKHSELALGAAIRASQLQDRTILESADFETWTDRETLAQVLMPSEPAGDVNVSTDLHVVRLDLPPSTDSKVLGQLDVLFSAVEKLVQVGRTEEAKSVLEELGRRAQRFLDRLSEDVVEKVLSSRKAVRAEAALGNAEVLIEEGDYERAVRESHLANQLSPDDPNIFERMIAIHIRAAEANASPESFEDALRWMVCAHAHDQSNMEIRERIAKQCYEQSRYVLADGRPRAALDLLDQGLGYYPTLEVALELQRRLWEGSGAGR